MKHMLPLPAVRLDPALQTRAKIDGGRAEEWSRLLLDDPAFDMEPVVVFRDPEGVYWLADGWHRWGAYMRAGLVRTKIPCVVREGSRRDALRYALGCNAEHDRAGIARTNADKRKAVEIALRDPEWGGWDAGKGGWPHGSGEAVAQLCGVTDSFVGKMKAEIHHTMPLTNLHSGDSGNGKPDKKLGKGKSEIRCSKSAGPGRGRRPTFEGFRPKLERMETKELERTLAYIQLLLDRLKGDA